MANEPELNEGQAAQSEEIKGKFLASCPERLKLREDTVKEANELTRSQETDLATLDALIEKNGYRSMKKIKFNAAKIVECLAMFTAEQGEKIVLRRRKCMSPGWRKRGAERSP
jgi:hypothetical protein